MDDIKFISKIGENDLNALLDKLQNSTKIYEPIDFKFTEHLIDSILKNYSDNVLKNTFEDAFKEIGYDALNSYIEGECETFHTRFLNLPLVWQEIVLLVFMALQLHRYVENNSRVVSLGESPLKLVFIQQLLTEQQHFSNTLKKNGLAFNVDYTYFPISSLSYFVSTSQVTSSEWKSNDILNSKIEFNLDIFISDNITKIINALSDGLLSHFALFRIDPLYIINEKQNIYIQDRAESYKTLITLFCFYEAMCRKQDLDLNQRKIFYDKFYIVTFDSKDNLLINQDAIIIHRINNFLYRLITKRTDTITEKEYHFIPKNYYYSNVVKDPDFCIKRDYNLFSNQHNLIAKVITFISVPEQTFNYARCMKSCKLSYDHKCIQEIRDNYIHDKKSFNLKQKGEDGYNCNIINLCLMIFINKLGPEYISNIIYNLDNISLEKLNINQTNFDEFHTEILDCYNKLNHSNVIENIINNKAINDKFVSIKKKIQNLLDTGLLGPCNYELPLIKKTNVIKIDKEKMDRIMKIKSKLTH
jgi:hypothetical protein